MIGPGTMMATSMEDESKTAQDPAERQTMLEAALKYARSGISVFPVWGIIDGQCACGQAGCRNVGKHPNGSLAPNGFKDATTDEATIRSWWKWHPNSNIGTPTVGRVVLDIDPRNGGDDTLAELERRHGP